MYVCEYIVARCCKCIHICSVLYRYPAMPHEDDPSTSPSGAMPVSHPAGADREVSRAPESAVQRDGYIHPCPRGSHIDTYVYIYIQSYTYIYIYYHHHIFIYIQSYLYNHLYINIYIIIYILIYIYV